MATTNSQIRLLTEKIAHTTLNHEEVGCLISPSLVRHLLRNPVVCTLHRMFLAGFCLVIALMCWLVSSVTLAAPPMSLDASNNSVLTRPIAMVVTLAAMSLAPFAFLTMTSFVKISTVFHIVKGALGLPTVPSNVVIMALSAALTVLVMMQVGIRISERAAPVLQHSPSDTVQLVRGLVDAAKEPVREFLQANASESERDRFFHLAREARDEKDRSSVSSSDMVVLIPSFMVTELMEAFALGFAVYLPFLVIDLVIANILLALGMQMLSPTQVSLPFKLLLFVSVDGWGLLSRTLVMDYVNR